MFSARSKAVFAAGITVALFTTTVVLRAEDPANEAPIQGGTITLPSEGDQNARYASMAKITFQQAVDAALSHKTGKLIKAELQDEDGFLVYNVEVVTPDNKRHEVKVDAGNGSVLKVDQGDSERESEHENDAD